MDTHSLLVQVDSGDTSKLIDCDSYSTLHRLLRVTKLVFKFVRLTKDQVQWSHGSNVMESHPFTDADRSRTLWLLVSQEHLPEDPRFSLWQHQFGLYMDSSNL